MRSEFIPPDSESHFKSPSQMSAFKHFEARNILSEFREQDDVIDSAVNRIEIGVGRLHENARQIQDELHTQGRALQDSTLKISHTQQSVDNLGSQVRYALKNLGKSRMIAYGICFCILLVVMIYILYEAGCFKKR